MATCCFASVVLVGFLSSVVDCCHISSIAAANIYFLYIVVVVLFVFCHCIKQGVLFSVRKQLCCNKTASCYGADKSFANAKQQADLL